MENLSFEILVILFLLLLNGFFAMSEIAVVSARKIRLQQRAADGFAGAQAALEIANQPSLFLSTIQIGITLVGILTGAISGATIATELESFFNQTQMPILAEYSQAISVGTVVVALTYLSLILGELAPKHIGLNNPERIAAAVAPMMLKISRLTLPLVHLLSFSTSLILRVLGVRPSTDPEITEEEIKLLIEQGAEGGIIEPEEEEMVQQVFRLAERPILAQMTPRTEIVWLDLEDQVGVIRAKLKSAHYSSYPVARGSVDNIVGMVQVKDLLAQCLGGSPLNLEEILYQPLYLPENMTILETLKRFRESHTQIAIIIDEFGGIQGLTTITDILEAIAGDFPDELDVTDPHIILREDGTYLLDGMLDIDKFKDLFSLANLPGEEENYYQTLGGFVITYLGRIPSAGESFEWENLRLEIVDMDGLRVDKILVTPGILSS